MSHALQSNNLPFAYARGRKSFDSAVADFKKSCNSDDGHQSGVQILLLLVKQGANGLNLTGEAVQAVPAAFHFRQSHPARITRQAASCASMCFPVMCHVCAISALKKEQPQPVLVIQDCHIAIVHV